ncbi:hypothetical protein [Sutcliffiella deserti]|uniref:hypothetical protein n=1 Tax=Sutcliffiella deserti TaxID=2875501 RepID=UPI001CBC6580|nr:hypothetical protein [Sutcliffiella deserti]
MKNITQTFVYLIEVVLVQFIILSLFSYLEHGDSFQWLQIVNTFEFINRFTIILALHQLIIFALIRLKFSAREDAVQSKIFCINIALHLDKYDMDFSELHKQVYDLVHERKEVMFNKSDIVWLKKFYEAIEIRNNTNDENFKNDFKSYLEYDKINAEHEKETLKYDWTNSFLLNILK